MCHDCQYIRQGSAYSQRQCCNWIDHCGFLLCLVSQHPLSHSLNIADGPFCYTVSYARIVEVVGLSVKLCLPRLMVTLAWGLGKPLSLLFDPFESVVFTVLLFVSFMALLSDIFPGSLHIRRVIALTPRLLGLIVYFSANC